MEKIRYMISDAAGLVNVESHVLRYWEDELELTIPRNELGHRYYTQENILEFQKIKEYKEKGYQLKAIKMLIHNEVGEKGVEDMSEKKNMNTQLCQSMPQQSMPQQTMQQQTMQQSGSMEKFQMMMTDIVRQAMVENNAMLGHEVGTQVGEHVIKEMNYLMREQDEQEEERFKKLDAAIRSNQKKHRVKKEKKKLFSKDRSMDPKLNMQ